MHDLDLAVRTLQQEGHSVVAYRDGKLLGAKRGAGVAPFVCLAAELGARLHGASVADKVAGRAVAMACVSLGVAALYAGLMSERALAELDRSGVAARSGRRVPFIENRDRSGPCPTEALVEGETDPGMALPVLAAFVERMQGCRPM